jgi:DNA-binding GntR family transcriptional regulator
VAAALDVDPGQARELLRAYADGQHRMWVRNEEEGIKPFGFSADQHAAVLALCELGDDEDYADAATADASMPRDPVELEERIAAEFLADEKGS